jgi:hypothetical protein
MSITEDALPQRGKLRVARTARHGEPVVVDFVSLAATGPMDKSRHPLGTVNEGEGAWAKGVLKR